MWTLSLNTMHNGYIKQRVTTEKKLIQSIRKAFTLLELIGRRDELRIAEMVQELKWKKSTVHRIAALKA